MHINFCCNPKVFLITWICFALLFIASLLLAFIGFPKILDEEVYKSVRLDKDTMQWDRFVELPFPIKFRTYIYNITNKDDVKLGKMPILEEKGPYVYDQTRKKTILKTNDWEDTVTYTQIESFKFNETESSAGQDEIVTIINPALLAIVQMAIGSMAPVKGIINQCLKDKKIFVVPEHNDVIIDVQVNDLLFDGIKFALDTDTDGWLCSLVKNQIKSMAADLRNSEVYKDETTQKEGLIFSFFGYKNNQDDGIYAIKRGRDDISVLGSIVRWNSTNILPKWKLNVPDNGDSCKLVRGTDSTLYPPVLPDNATFTIYNTDLCRSVDIHYKRKNTYKGIEGYQFEVDYNTLRPSTDDPEDDCYCTKSVLNETGNSSCFLDGTIDMMPCFGAPVVFSFPHFLWADDKYLEGVEGLDPPNEDKHKIFLLVEPNTGTPLEGMKRIQINVVMRPDPAFQGFENLLPTMLPVLWIEEGIALGDDLVDELNERYFDKVKLVDGVRYSLIAVTAAGLVIFSALWIWKMYF